ncbi:haloacid dehalogenase type II [bacterium]|nr:haloacid dehalogenase type II [bacterium]
MPAPTYIFFDVNETLTDFSPVFAAATNALGGGDAQGRRWFNTMIEYSLAETLSAMHNSFIDIGAATLSMVAAEDGNVIALEDARSLLSEAIGKVTLWDDVSPGLTKLANEGFKLATLTNSSEAGQKERLDALGIADYLDEMIGVESSGAYKPDKRTFNYALSRMHANAEQSLMVACHPWDLIGARAIGMRIAFVERPGTAWYPLAEVADYHVQGIDELADVLADEAKA